MPPITTIGFLVFCFAHFKIFKFAFLAFGFNLDLKKDPKAMYEALSFKAL